MDRIVKFVIIAALGALALVFFMERARASQVEAWDALASAREAGLTIEQLEEALVKTQGSPAEAFARLYLASECLNEGSLANVQRARQVAEDGLRANESHPTSTWLEKIAEAAASLEG